MNEACYIKLYFKCSCRVEEHSIRTNLFTIQLLALTPSHVSLNFETFFYVFFQSTTVAAKKAGATCSSSLLLMTALRPVPGLLFMVTSAMRTPSLWLDCKRKLSQGCTMSSYTQVTSTLLDILSFNIAKEALSYINRSLRHQSSTACTNINQIN